MFVIAQSEKPKNIILMIGDGMGLSQISMAYYFQKDKTNFDRFFDIGLIITSSKSHKITDSAAGATAFSTGKKTYNGAIGLDADSNTVPNIVEIINKEKQMSAGLVATSSITHATPACFYAHQKNRNMEYEIASDLIKSPVVYFAGGGKKFFKPIQKQLADQFLLDTTELQIKHLKPDKRYGFLLAENGMPKWSESRGDFLIKATKLGMDRLSLDTNGFFLMVEASQIDWGGHANDPDFILSELIDFDKTIGRVLDFAEINQETLVIVTADHETGGLALTAENTKDNKRNYRNIEPAFTSGGHSATLVPVYAFGPGSDQFRGTYHNTEIFEKIVSLIK